MSFSFLCVSDVTEFVLCTMLPNKIHGMGKEYFKILGPYPILLKMAYPTGVNILMPLILMTK